jgi:arylsulfatase A-like enzyme
LRRVAFTLMELGVVVVSFALTTPAVADNRPPNFIIFFTDDQGYGDVGCYGSSIVTPHMDRMAAEGIRFTSFYAQNVCGTSRAALMTGSYPIRCAEPGNRKHPHTVLHPREVTIAEVLKPRGYATACIGKWHLGMGDSAPNRQGFDYFYGTPEFNGLTRRIEDHPFRSPLLRNDQVLMDAIDQPTMDALTGLYTDEAIGFIEQNRDRPFFLYLSHSMPHVPLGASEGFRGRSGAGLYADVIMEVDDSLARVLRTLQELDLDSRTLVIFTSDNGPWVEKVIDDHGGSAAPLRGWKMTTWEGGPRVPCIARWPGRVSAGKASDAMLTTMDLLPTLAKLAGAAIPADRTLDGMDVTAALLGQADTSPRRTFFYYSWTHLQAVREGPWKLVLPRPANPPWTSWYGRMIEAIEAPQLYNLAQDLGETHDLAAEHPQVVTRLTGLVEEVRSEMGDYDRIGSGARFYDHGPRRPESDRWVPPGRP